MSTARATSRHDSSAPAATFTLADGAVATSGEALPKGVADSQPIVLLPSKYLQHLGTKPLYLTTTVGGWRAIAEAVLHILNQDGYEALVGMCTSMTKYIKRMEPRLVQLRRKYERGDARAANEYSKYTSAVAFLLGFMVKIQHKNIMVVLELPPEHVTATVELPCFLVTDEL